MYGSIACIRLLGRETKARLTSGLGSYDTWDPAVSKQSVSKANCETRTTGEVPEQDRGFFGSHVEGDMPEWQFNSIFGPRIAHLK